MEKIYPIDIDGIKNLGVEEWLKNYYVPVTGKEYHEIYKSILNIYITSMKKYESNDYIYQIAVSNLKIPGIIATFVLEIQQLLRLKKEGYACLLGKKKMSIDEPPYHLTNIEGVNIVGKSIEGLTFSGVFKNYLRTIKNNVYCSRLLVKDVFNKKPNLYFLLGSRTTEELIAFCNKDRITPIWLPQMLFISKNMKTVSASTLPNCAELMAFVNEFIALIEENYPLIRKQDFKVLKKEIEECFKDSLLFYHNNIVFLRKWMPKKLLATGLGKPIQRLFCSAWRYAGGEVIGICHGNGYCRSYLPPVILDGATIANKYVVTSSGHEEIWRRSIKDFFLGLKSPEIIHLDNFYIRLFDELQKNPPVNKVRKVMLIGTILKGYSFIDSEYHYFAFLHLELRIIRYLRSAGYHIIYKPRPDTLHMVEGIYEDYADEVLTDKFEDVYQYADCLLFTSPYSTTFGFSLLTNKPIVLMNVNGYTWYPRALELIKRRCSVVEAESVDGKIVFDEKDVLNAIECSHENIDYEILHEFAF